MRFTLDYITIAKRGLAHTVHDSLRTDGKMVPKRGLRPGVLLFFPLFMVKRKPLRHKRKRHLFFGNLSFAVSIGKTELPMTLRNGRKW
jgi:hypothetical protein